MAAVNEEELVTPELAWRQFPGTEHYSDKCAHSVAIWLFDQTATHVPRLVPLTAIRWPVVANASWLAVGHNACPQTPWRKLQFHCAVACIGLKFCIASRYREWTTYQGYWTIYNGAGTGADDVFRQYNAIRCFRLAGDGATADEHCQNMLNSTAGAAV
jgi:hypothetical protein